MRDRAPVIFRIQEPPPQVETCRDYSSCRGYGTMVTLLGPLDNPSVNPDECYSKLVAGLADARDGDFILWAGGDPMSAFFAGLVIGELDHGPALKWLRWDKRTNEDGSRSKYGYYVPVEF